MLDITATVEKRDTLVEVTRKVADAATGANILLGASVFHFKLIEIPVLKKFLADRGFSVRI